MHLTDNKPRILIIEPYQKGETEQKALIHGSEMSELLQTLGRSATLIIAAKVPEKTGAFFFGKGRLNELKETVTREACELIILDGALSPIQQRNFEEYIGVEVLDREAVILEIFAARAKTKEASLQVELARLEYRLPRISRMTFGGERQRGGVKGTKGSGETKQETDKRIIRKRITELRKEIDTISQSRCRQRQERLRGEIPLIALVGYTNSGKSTLLNTLSGSSVFADNILFATLDPTTRRIRVPEMGSALLTDTVGFIRKLPHSLINAFRSTLEEVTLADIILHVVDASNSENKEHIRVTESVLDELGAQSIPKILVFNKEDITSEEEKNNLMILYNEAVFISAKSGSKIENLWSKIRSCLQNSRSTVTLHIPFEKSDTISYIMSRYTPEKVPADDHGYLLTLALSPRDKERLAPFITNTYNA